MIFYSFILLI